MSDIVVTEVQAGGTVRVAVGAGVLIRLPENPSTGYRWQFEVTGSLTLLDDTYSSSSSLPGAAGERALRLAASAPGQHAFSATLRRAWETGVAPQASFSITLEAG